MTTVRTFDTFEAGQAMGSHDVTVDRAMFDRWTSLYGGDLGETAPGGMAMVVVMRSYMAIVTPRPPGNIHAGQHFEMHALPKLGDRVTTDLVCQHKQERKGRRWVTWATTTRASDGTPLFDGRITTIWAA